MEDSGLRNITDAEIIEQLSIAGLTKPLQAHVLDPNSAGEEAEKMGVPVALKIVSDEISHKTEAGGVILNLGDGESVEKAAKNLQKTIGSEKIKGFLIQEMVDGLEMLVGVREDPDFGPLVVVGLGGIFVELIRDVSLRLAPIDNDEAHQMLKELRGTEALRGFRGQTPRDINALKNAITSLSNYFLENRSWLEEIEINPLIVLAEGKGVRAVDVRPVRRV